VGPIVVAETPPAWVAAEIAQPPLAGASGARFTQWEAARSPDSPEGSATLVRGCVETPIPGWVPDMRTAVEARGHGLAMATAERTSGAQAERRDEGGRPLVRTMGAPDGSPPIGAVKTFLGFDGHDVATCFAVCTTTAAAHPAKPHALQPTCESVVASAHLTGGTDPPKAGLVMGAASWAVHHPVRTAAGSALAACALGVLAVVGRRKPRSRI